MYNVLDTIEQSVNHIANLKKQVIKAKKVQLHTGIEGYNSPESYGIYRNTGGNCLGVVGNRFEPANLELFLDAIETSVMQSGVDVDLTKLTYNEYYDGSKIVFRLPLKKYELKTPMVGDTMETAIEFRTGFDGETKLSLGFYAYRLWCANGAKNWVKDVNLTMKNTINNQAKMFTFVNEIIKVVDMSDAHANMLNLATKIDVNKAMVNKFITDVTGYNVADYANLTTRSRNIIDRINQSVAIEMQNTGNNLFSLLQGITRYTTHDVANGDIQKILYSQANEINVKAHQLVYAELN